jgi:hypothetical protein
VRVRAQINHCADEHVAADAAEDVEVKCFHLLGGPSSMRPKFSQGLV